MTEAEKAYQYFVIAVPENEEQAKAYFWARKALQSTLTQPNEGAKDKNVPTNGPLTLEELRLMVEPTPVWWDAGLTPEEVQQMRWIPVEERLPGDSDGAVLLTNGKTVISGYRNQLFGLDGQHGIFVPAIKKGGGYMQVTHWMPLPKLPKEGTNGKH